ncbi:MAG TPA: hypothetical protein VMZ66_08815 [Aeromicrobium sp.]|nr:hypothetical protein [Aeromicrobium sp.]
MSAIVSGAAAAALTAGLAAGLAVENGQIRPYAEVQHHGAPGPALIEKVEASAGGSNLVTQRALKTVPDVSGIDGGTVSDVCRSEASSPALDAVLCALSGNVESLLEPLLAGLNAAD